MLERLATLLQQQLDNQVFAGGLALGALGAAAAIVGRLLWAAAARIGSRLLPSLMVDRRSPLFGYLQAWLRDHPYTRSCRRLMAATAAEGETGDTWLVPGEGSHLVRHGRHLFWLVRSRDVPTGRNTAERERLLITALSPWRATLTGLVEEVIRSHGRRAGTLGLFVATGYGEWGEVGRIARRPLASVIVADAIEVLLEDARRFLAAREHYATRGVPWRRGYLFHGPPGTGKTSLIRALASELDLDLAILDLSLPELSDGSLRKLLARIPNGAAVVLEDVDAVAPGRGDGDRKLTLSGLLNALDGLGASEGHLLFMTTNHRERLDPALIRPGRIDRSVALGPLGPDEIERMVTRFFPHRPDLGRRVVERAGGHRLSAAELQGILIASEEPEAVLDAIGALDRKS